MSADHAAGALTGEERRVTETVDAVLDREMSVEPSPDFAAKVRARIEASEPAGERSVAWGLAAAAAILIASGIVLASLRSGPSSIASTPMVSGRDVALPAPEPARSPVPDPRPRAGRASRGSRLQESRSRIVPSAEPEVLVPPDLRLAVARVMGMVRAGTLNEDVFPAQRGTASVGEGAEPVGPVLVDELQVLPIDVAGGGVEKGFGLD
jgi:hypothetical protein